MSNNKPDSVPRAPSETVEEPSAVGEDDSKMIEEEEPCQDPTEKGSTNNNGVHENGRFKSKERKPVSGEKRKREKRKFPSREEISRIR